MDTQEEERILKVSNEIQRPRNCGECARMDRFHAVIDGVEYDGGCPEFGVHVRNTDVCHPNVDVRKEMGKWAAN